MAATKPVEVVMIVSQSNVLQIVADKPVNISVVDVGTSYIKPNVSKHKATVNPIELAAVLKFVRVMVEYFSKKR